MPTNATKNAAHIAVGVAAALIVPRVLGKGTGSAVLGALIAVALHAKLDTPVARLMAANGLQLR